MKRCPECGRTFNDETLRFCRHDGKPLTRPATRLPAPLRRLYLPLLGVLSTLPGWRFSALFKAA